MIMYAGINQFAILMKIGLVCLFFLVSTESLRILDSKGFPVFTKELMLMIVLLTGLPRYKSIIS